MAFFFLLFYVIVLLIRPQEWYEPLEGLQLVNIAAITTIFTTFITKRPGEPLQRVLSRDQFAKFMWAFLGVIIFSDLTRVRLRYAIDALSEFGKISVLFFLTMILVDTPQRARRLMWMIVWCAGIMCIHGYLQIETGEGFGHIKPYGSFEEGEFRIIGSGLFSDPNDFALLFIVSTAFVFSLLRLQGGFSKVALIVILGAMLFCLYYTQSRGGVAGFCAMLTATVWIVGRKKGVRLIVSAILLAAVVALGPSRATESVYEGSAGGRIEMWGIGNEILKHSPLLGAGYGRFFDFSEDRAAHSSFVHCYAELGVIGYMVWFGLIWFVIRSLRNIARMQSVLDPLTTKLATGVFASLVGFMTSAFFLSRTYNALLFLLLGLGAGIIRYAQSQPGVPVHLLTVTRRDFSRSCVVALLSIPAIWLLIRYYWANA